MSFDDRTRQPRRRAPGITDPLRRIGMRGMLACTAVLLCAGLCAGCSDDPESVTIVPQCLEFDSDSSPAGGNVIARTAPGSECNRLKLELVATDIADIWSADIVISYPVALTRAFGVEVGAFLTDDGEAVSCGAEAQAHGVDCVPVDDFLNGKLQIDLSRTNLALGGVDAGPAGEVLLTLTFIQLTGLQGANGPMTYEVGKLGDDGNGGAPQTIIDNNPDADPPPLLPDGAFIGGTMIIRDQSS